MCQFLSAIVLENGDIICDPEHTDSHEDLIRVAGIRDSYTQHGRFARIEFLLPNHRTQIADLTTWKLILNEQNTPEWWNANAVRNKLERLVVRQIVSDERFLLLGGWWILIGNADVIVVKNARIISMQDSARIYTISGSSQVNVMYDSSQIDKMRNFSQVGVMNDSSRVNTMDGLSWVGQMHDFSQVGKMWDFTQVGITCNSSQVDAMYDSSQVNEMRDFSQVGVMNDSSRVIYGTCFTRIVQDNRKK